MPKKDGLEVLNELRSRHILTPVLLLTAKAEVDDRVTGLDAGADDYLPKPFAMKELLARIRAMTRRSSTFSEGEWIFGDISLNAENFAMSAHNSVRLSIKEFELMQTLIANSDLDLTTEYLLSHVWKHEPEAQEDTVWLYISYLKGKRQGDSKIKKKIYIDSHGIHFSGNAFYRSHDQSGQFSRHAKRDTVDAELYY